MQALVTTPAVVIGAAVVASSTSGPSAAARSSSASITRRYEKFAEMIDHHWKSIAAYCEPENKVSLGFVDGLHTKIRGIERRACGLRGEEFLRLKILTCMLPEL
jgi:transposase